MRGSEDAIELSVTMNKAIVILNDPQGSAKTWLSRMADRADRVDTIGGSEIWDFRSKFVDLLVVQILQAQRKKFWGISTLNSIQQLGGVLRNAFF